MSYLSEHWNNQNHKRRFLSTSNVETNVPEIIIFSFFPLRHLANLKVPVHYHSVTLKEKYFVYFLIKSTARSPRRTESGKGRFFFQQQQMASENIVFCKITGKMSIFGWRLIFSLTFFANLIIERQQTELIIKFFVSRF